MPDALILRNQLSLLRRRGDIRASGLVIAITGQGSVWPSGAGLGSLDAPRVDRLLYWRNTLDTGIASREIFFGDPADRFTSGDWGIVDDIDTPAVFRPSNSTFYFRHTLTQGIADSQFTWNAAGSGWLPVSSDFGLD